MIDDGRREEVGDKEKKPTAGPFDARVFFPFVFSQRQTLVRTDSTIRMYMLFVSNKTNEKKEVGTEKLKKEEKNKRSMSTLIEKG